MAQKINIVLVDDIDGTEGAETLRFGIDGQNYEIDLAGKNAEEFRKTLERYASKGRKVKHQRRRRTKLEAVS